ncbi:MAG: hypothetical protein HYT87_15245 [Nitrospirae bacterium]|nr:hypothetical protein [Nitrospirota bacterium]
MRLWSKGLGSKYILPLNLCEAEVALGDGGVVLKGIIPVRKVRWWYKMALSEDDMIRFVRFVNRNDVRAFLARHGGMRLWIKVVMDSAKFVGYYVMSWLRKPSAISRQPSSASMDAGDSPPAGESPGRKLTAES